VSKGVRNGPRSGTEVDEGASPVQTETSPLAGQIILAIWHRVTKDEVIRYGPSLADKGALRSGAGAKEGGPPAGGPPS
jgi:hypothetical protein